MALLEMVVSYIVAASGLTNNYEEQAHTKLAKISTNPGHSLCVKTTLCINWLIAWCSQPNSVAEVKLKSGTSISGLYEKGRVLSSKTIIRSRRVLFFFSGSRHVSAPRQPTGSRVSDV